MRIRQLHPGDRFRQPELELTGTLVKVNDCRARVLIDGPASVVEFNRRNGQHVAFIDEGRRYQGWTPSIEVERIHPDTPEAG